MLENLEELNIVDWGYTEISTPFSFDKYQSWVKGGSAAPLKYLQDERKNLRADIKLIFPEFKSALVFLFSYADVMKLPEKRVAGFALGFEGLDYHYALKDRLNLVIEQIQTINADIKCKIVVDTHPILERDLAYRAGLGWFGKNSMLISKKFGSYNMIGSILLDSTLPLETRGPSKNYCGECRKCIDSCPTNAINPDSTIETSKCISTYTIEIFKDTAPPEGYDSSKSFFGCDICQEICPWNEKFLLTLTQKPPTPQLGILNELLQGRSNEEIRAEIESLSNSEYKKRFRGTSFARLGKIGLLKNLNY